MVVWYSLVGSNGKATPDDITLKQAGIKTVVICGNSFQGATVGTASGAAQRGYKVIVPVDCSAGEDVYHEQYAAFHLAKGGPVGVTSNVTMTRSTMIKF
jgi:nicotinamidase-related amidase